MVESVEEAAAAVEPTVTTAMETAKGGLQPGTTTAETAVKIEPDVTDEIELTKADSPASAEASNLDYTSSAGAPAESAAGAVEVEVFKSSGYGSESANGGTSGKGLEEDDGRYEFKIESPRSDSLPEVYKWPLNALVSLSCCAYIGLRQPPPPSIREEKKRN